MDEATKQAAAIDPVEVRSILKYCPTTILCRPLPSHNDSLVYANPPCTTQPNKILAAVQALGATVTIVLTTHKHWCVRAYLRTRTHTQGPDRPNDGDVDQPKPIQPHHPQGSCGGQQCDEKLFARCADPGRCNRQGTSMTRRSWNFACIVARGRMRSVSGSVAADTPPPFLLLFCVTCSYVNAAHPILIHRHRTGGGLHPRAAGRGGADAGARRAHPLPAHARVRYYMHTH